MLSSPLRAVGLFLTQAVKASLVFAARCDNYVLSPDGSRAAEAGLEPLSSRLYLQIATIPNFYNLRTIFKQVLLTSYNTNIPPLPKYIYGTILFYIYVHNDHNCMNNPQD